MTQTTDTTDTTDLPFDLPDGVEITGERFAGAHDILSRDALEFVAALEREFGARRRELLGLREKRQLELDAGERPNFLTETADVRRSGWRVAEIPADLRCRQVEITGPVERKMIINALNSRRERVHGGHRGQQLRRHGATSSRGRFNLRDAVRRDIDFAHPETGKEYASRQDQTATLVRASARLAPGREATSCCSMASRCRPRSSTSRCTCSTTRRELLKRRGTGPYFYLPKMENHLEARLVERHFRRGTVQAMRDAPNGTIRATVLIETILAAFEMDEILWELRDHSAGLNCGRWDYIFSFIKRFRAGDAGFVLPDRGTGRRWTDHFLRSYSQLLIQTCHRAEHPRDGRHGGADPDQVDDADLKNAAADCEGARGQAARSGDGHDGTWVAHPGSFRDRARGVRRADDRGDNQIDVTREDV